MKSVIYKKTRKDLIKIIDIKDAIKELNTDISFISREFLNKHPETTKKLENQNAFNTYMSTEGEIATLLENIINLKKDLEKLLEEKKQNLERIRNDKDISYQARLYKFDYIKGQINILEHILNNYI